MDVLVLTRRAALAGVAGLVLSPVLARAATYNRFRAVKVDTLPLRATGDTISAGVFAQTMPAALQQSFGPYLAPGDRSAPLLVARIRSASYGVPGSANSPFSGTGAIDYIEGDAVVVGANGKAIATYPLTCSLLSLVDLHDITGNSANRRIATLGESFAHFLPGKMGL